MVPMAFVHHIVAPGQQHVAGTGRPGGRGRGGCPTPCSAGCATCGGRTRRTAATRKTTGSSTTPRSTSWRELYRGRPRRRGSTAGARRRTSPRPTSYIAHWADLTTHARAGRVRLAALPPVLPRPAGDAAPLRLATRRCAARAGMMIDCSSPTSPSTRSTGCTSGAFSRIYPEPTLERWKQREHHVRVAPVRQHAVPARPVNVVLPRAGLPAARRGADARAQRLRAARGDPPDCDRPEHAVSSTASSKRTRHRIRYSDVRERARLQDGGDAPARYAVGSVQGGLLQPIQQHTWEVLWATARPEGFNVLFTVHPYADPHELGMYFPEEPGCWWTPSSSTRRTRTTSRTSGRARRRSSRWSRSMTPSSCSTTSRPGTRYEHVSGYVSRTLQ